MYDLLLKGGSIASTSGVELADVAIRSGSIARVGAIAPDESAQVMDITGLTVLPSTIDTQVHFRQPGMEHKEDLETGMLAALTGGITGVLEMPNTLPPTTSANALQDKLSTASETPWTNYGFFVGATCDNASELSLLERFPGTPGVKLFMGSSTGSLLVPDDASIKRVLDNGTRRVVFHSEDHFRLEDRKQSIPIDATAQYHPVWRDERCAIESTERLIRLSAETARPIHILHISTAEECRMIWQAKKAGIDITCEATPQHLFFAAPEAYEKLGSLVQMNPPIRTKEHRDAIRKALQDGLFDVVGSDHAPHTLEEKSLPYPTSPSGMPGVQTMLPAMLNFVNQGLISINQLVQLVCQGPAQLYGIQGKGKVEPGYDADLSIVDLNRSSVVQNDWIRSKCKWTPFAGEPLTGWPVHVVLNGQVALRDGEAIAQAGTQMSFVS
jgi:dihydroorotase